MDEFRAVTEIVADYCHGVDRGDASAVASLFAENGELEIFDHTFSGRNAIREGVAVLLRTQLLTFHATWGTRLIDRDGTLTATTRFLTYVPKISNQPQRQGRWEDAFVMDGTSLWLSHRVVRFSHEWPAQTGSR